MTQNATKRWLTLATVVLLIAATGILVWGFSAPSAGDSVTSQRVAETTTGPTKAAKTSISAAKPDRATKSSAFPYLAGLVDRPLRRPLFDPPPPPPKVVERKVLPPIRARLMATMIEAENSTAVLRMASGAVIFRKAGELLGTEEPNAKIAHIEAGSVCVTREGDETRLVIDGQKGK